MRSIKDYGKSNGSNLAEKYAGKSESELMQALAAAVDSAKTDGTFSPDELDGFSEFVSPNLDDAQRKRLAELISMIKSR